MKKIIIENHEKKTLIPDETRIDIIGLVYFSPTGSSKTAAEIIGDVISEEFKAGREILDLCRSDFSDRSAERFSADMDDRTVCIFSAPCYGGRIPQLAAERLAAIKGNQTPAIVCVTFGNRAYEDALLELADLVEKNGFRVIAGCAVVTEHNIMHEFGKGRPDESDRKQIAEFSGKVVSKIREGLEIASPAIPGDRPYKKWNGSKLPIAVDENKCINCGICAESCPTGAIEVKNWKTDENTCIHCMRCIEYCPSKCRYVPEKILRMMTERLRAACEARKENEFFVG